MIILMKDKIGIIFIHGAGLGSYIWHDLARLIKLPSLAVDLPNRLGDKSLNSKLELTDYLNSIKGAVDVWGVEKLFIVAHSIGGILGLRLADSLGERVVGFAAISAAIPPNGKSFLSCLPFPKNLLTKMIIRVAGTMPPKSAIVQGLCNDLNKEQTDLVIKNFTAEGKSLYLDECQAAIPSVPKLFIKLTNDKEFPPTMQDEMAKNMQANSVATIHAGHLPMLSATEQLAEILNNFTRDVSLKTDENF